MAAENWNNSRYRTSVAARLVERVYLMEKNRVSEEPSQLLPEMLNFTLHETLISECDNSIYGAIFEYSGHYYDNHRNIPSLRTPPRYVIAFRGTDLKPDTMFCDALQDLRIAFGRLHRGTRFSHAIHAIMNMVAKHKDTSIWLAGHSLGAGLALLAGKTMAMSGVNLESYIFNPPIMTFPMEQISNCRLIKGGIGFTASVIKASIAKIFKDLEEDDPSTSIASWTPNLYVNPRDLICAEYIGYFKNKKFMAKMKFLSKIERIASKYPIRSIFFGKDEPLHLLSSAYMTVNISESHGRRRACKPRNWLNKRIEAHRLHQWWDESINCLAKQKSCSLGLTSAAARLRQPFLRPPPPLLQPPPPLLQPPPPLLQSPPHYKKTVY
ncbi:unnamed protein product [Microthlaspi erraticum]|uniref:Fungal lipase-type domain-containing protein n=1 Tax=Microthlaspi erraticum TaxID=1685480 RepID=A0A6D2JTN9_9BRAS|nr:unnamed protein product [Microthlaspi erraticum]